MKKTAILLIVSLCMVFAGAILASLVQSDFGRVKVEDILVATGEGAVLSALLYVPPNATVENPAPGIVTIEGYLNSREMQTNFSIEFARRGYVVLAIDMFGHGRSGTEAVDFVAAQPAVRYLSALGFVDSRNIGIEGHSKGGLAATMAAAALPAGSVKSVLAAGSGLNWPLLYGVEWSADTPINYGTIFGTHDEFGWLFWPETRSSHGNVSAYANYSPVMMNAWGTADPVEPLRWYGSKAANTLRIMYQPRATHTRLHVSGLAAGYAANFMNETLAGGNPRGLADTDVIWHWKEAGTAVSMLGAFLFLFAFGTLLLSFGKNSEYMSRPAEGKAVFNLKFWIMLIVGTAIPALTFFVFMNIGTFVLPMSRVFPQEVGSQVSVWASFNGLISLGLLILLYFIFGKKEGADFGEWGFKTGGKNILRQALLGFGTALGAYLLLCFVVFIFKVDFRFHVIGLMPLTLTKFQAMCAYFVFFAIFALCNSLALNATYRFAGGSYLKTAIFSVIANVGGMAALLVIGYGGLAVLGYLPFSNTGWSLRIIQAISFAVFLPMAALLNTWFFKKTGSIYMGSVISALFLVFATVGNTCFQFIF
ncbi:MAG: S9 family peptidase [Treponema sp.]|nr:S9 family peptidase [Treponema sp.]